MRGIAEYREERRAALRKLPFGGSAPDGQSIAVNSRYLLRDGRPWLPVMGEFHFSRYDSADWETELRKMKAGGVEIAATYIFWIHHEEEKGVWNFEGSRCLREFILACRRAGLLLFLRIGPWAHGECRNGGFPDWVVQDAEMRPRTNDPRYLACVRELFGKIGEQASGLLWKDGGPVVGVQIENEYWCENPDAPGVGAAHMRELKRIAVEAGLDAPLYTATAWGGAAIAEGEMLPVESGYVDAPWDQHTDELPESPHFLMQTVRDDPIVGRDLKQGSAGAPSRFGDTPYLTAELGGGMQPTDHRRVVAFPRDTEALAFCKLGSGANLLGYYMYHGGTNPDGRLSTLQESRDTGYPNDLPVKSYDFEAPLGECGLAGGSYSRLRRLHLFVREWGGLLAPAETVIPPDSCRDPADREALRWSFRYNPEADCGFVFVNNHLRKRVLPDRENIRLTVRAGGREYTLPPVTVRNGENAILPYRLPLGDALLLGSNASPLTRLGKRYFFYTDGEPVYEFEGEPAEIVTLTREQARMAVKIGDRLYLSPVPLFEKDGKVFAETSGEDAVIDVYEEKGGPRRLTVPAPEFAGGVTFRETAPGVYMLSLRYGGGFDDCVLELAFAGDKARLYLGDRLIADWFSTGLPFRTALRQHGFPETLRLELDGPRAGVYRDIGPAPGFGLKSAGLIPVSRLRVDG